MKPFTIIFALAMVSLGGVGASQIVGDRLFAPAPKAIGAPPEWLDAEPVSIASDSGSRLSGWLHRPASPEAVVVLMHAVRGNRRSMLGRARFLANAGHAVLLFDFQAHGESVGEHITFGYLEARDAVAAVAYAKQRLQGVPVIVLGYSLGGVSALLADPPLKVDGFVLEAVFPDVTVALRNRVRLRLGRAGAALTPLISRQIRPRFGIAPGDISPVAAASGITAPVFVISGTADERTTRDDTLRLFEAFRSQKELWLIDGARHENLHSFAGAEYERRILEFVARAVDSTLPPGAEDPDEVVQ